VPVGLAVSVDPSVGVEPNTPGGIVVVPPDGGDREGEVLTNAGVEEVGVVVGGGVTTLTVVVTGEGAALVEDAVVVTATLEVLRDALKLTEVPGLRTIVEVGDGLPPAGPAPN